MRKSFYTILFTCVVLTAFGQLNMTLTDQINYPQGTSSLWGYIDPEDSTEYAAVGTRTGVSVVDLTDPYNIQQIAFKPDQNNTNSTWREVKSYGHYIYSVTEAGGGVQVINMNNPANVTSTNWAPTIPGLGTLNSIHSITVDEFGYLYLNGSNLNGGGPIIVDVSADNGMPVYVGKLPNIYAHDSYARNNILYTSDIYQGRFSVYDVTNKSNPVLLAQQNTPYAFTHNTWLNDAGDVIFTTDEKQFAPVTAYDISDLSNIVELDRFRPIATSGNGNIPHNVHVWDDWVVTAYYTEGTLIIDGSRPENMIEVGYFDSFVSQNAGFYGVWGVYPYFPSGLVIASDMTNGLLVYDVNYVRACWLEGKVTNAITGANVSGCSVSIASSQANAATTNLSGDYKTGQAIPGTFNVTFTASGYFPKTVPATLENGVLTILDVALEPLVINPFPPFTFTAPTSGCEPLTIDFFENTGVVATWSWSFPGGTPSSSTEQNPSVTYTTPGTHDVSLQVVTNGGNNYSVAMPGLVTVAPAPEASFGNSVDSTTVTFTNGSTNYNNLLWDFGDGNTSTDSDPQHEYHGAGTYTATLTVYGDCGVESYSQDVTIGPFVPQAAFNADLTSGCAPLTVAFTDQSTNQPTSWEWAFLGGSPVVSDQQNPTVTYSSPGTFDVNLVVSNAAGTSVFSSPGQVSVGGGPTASFSASANGPEVSFANASSGPAQAGALSYSWDFGDGTTSTEASPSHSFLSAGTFTVQLTVTNGCGTQTFSEAITIGDFVPQVAFTQDVTTGCAPLIVAFTDQSTNGPTYWEWSFPGGEPAVSLEQNPVVTYSVPGVYDVNLLVQNAWANNNATQQGLITVNGLPTPSFDFSASQNDVTFTNTSQNAASYEWFFNDGSSSSSTEASPSHSFPGPGSYEVVLNATNGCGTVSYTATVTISAVAPTASFTFGNTVGCAPLTVTFTDQSAGQPTSWQWSFPGGTPSSSTEQNPTVTYTGAGIFDVTLVVNNSAGTSEVTQTGAISVGAAPVAGFTFNVVDNDLEASFINTSTNYGTLLWNFGDGSTSTEENPQHTYAAFGTFTVTLIAMNACGSTLATQVVTVSAVPPAASFSKDPQSGDCAPVTVTFHDESSGVVTSWNWSFPGGSPATSTDQDPTVVYLEPGEYPVELTVTGPGGSDTVSADGVVHVESLPEAAFELSVLEFTVSFNNTSLGDGSSFWDFGDGNTSTSGNPFHTYSEYGVYEVTLTVTNECGSDTTTQTVTILPNSTKELGVPYLLSASPNPFGNELAVAYELKGNFSKASLVLTDALGRTLSETPVTAASGRVELGSDIHASGVYFLRLVVDGHSSGTLRVVKL